jgi:hypothetical protein
VVIPEPLNAPQVGTPLPLRGADAIHHNLHREAQVMTDTRGQADLPTAFETLEPVLLLIAGAVVAGPILPGLTRCVAGLITPYLLVRSMRGVRAGRTAPASAASPSLG